MTCKCGNCGCNKPNDFSGVNRVIQEIINDVEANTEYKAEDFIHDIVRDSVPDITHAILQMIKK